MNPILLDYFNNDELAASAWLGKYAKENEITPDDMHERLASHFFNADKSYHKKDLQNLSILSEYGKTRENLTKKSIYEMFKDFKYIVPQGSIMSQLGSDSIGSLSNCFVIGQPEDSYGGIFLKDQEQVQLMKRRGGVGIDISKLRPSGVTTTNAAKSSTGAVSFMHRYSNSTREVAQNGRRGALMISIDVDHPDVLEFIKIKRDLSQVTGANISVKLNDKFMEAVNNDEDYLLRWPCDSSIDFKDIEDFEYDKLYHFNDSKLVTKKVKAKKLWDEIIKSAHNVAEPGLMFWDRMVNYSPDGVYPQFKQVTTNPCSEIAMQPYDACRLIAVNLFSFVINPFTEDAYFDFDKFYSVNYEAMRLSDDLVDLEMEHIERILEKIDSDPEPNEIKKTERELWKKIYTTASQSRRTGLGFTALGDALAALNIKYDSNKSVDTIKEIMKTKLTSEIDCTTDLAKVRGSFKGFDSSKEFSFTDDFENIKGNNDFYQFLVDLLPLEKIIDMIKYGRRNVSWSTVAPTGTVSLMTQTTSGIEPLFMAFYMRRKKVNANDKNQRVDFTDQNGDTWQEFPVLHERFKNWIKIQDPNVIISELTSEDLNEYFIKSPWYNATANDIDWVKRVEIQSTIQKYISHSISSTINLPSDVKEEEVSTIYLESHKKGLKGITVYRDGSRSGVLVSNEKKEEITKFNEHHAPKRPKSLEARLVRFNNNKEKWIAFIGVLDNKPYEIFTGRVDEIAIPTRIENGFIVKNKTKESRSYDFEYEGGVEQNIDKTFHQDYWNYGRLISGVLRHGMPMHYVIGMIGTLKFDDDHINTWKAGVSRALKKFIPDGKVEGVKCQNPDCTGDRTNVIFEEGCMKCLDCGNDKCS